MDYIIQIYALQGSNRMKVNAMILSNSLHGLELYFMSRA